MFLDEITEMDISLQAKLLRVLQERSLERLGSNRIINVDVRVIAASNRNPRQAIAEQKLREDLFYRLNVFTIALPPLRERREDIVPLANFFLRQHAGNFGFEYNGIEPDAESCLLAYGWPGNVRELANMMERAIVLSGGKKIAIHHLPADVLAYVHEDKSRQQSAPVDNSLASFDFNQQVGQFEKQLIEKALANTDDNKSKAALLLGISERSLWYKVKKYAIGKDQSDGACVE